MQSDVQVQAIHAAIAQLKKGGVIAYPTESVFGLGCDPFNKVAVQKILHIKNRPEAKGMILIASSWEQIFPLVLDVPAERFAKVQSTWPGPETWVFPASDMAPAWICGAHQTIALRVTAHPIARALCAAFGGPIVSTSANRADCVPARDAQTVRAQLGDQVAFIVPGKVGDLARPTSIRDVLTGNVLRA